MSGDANGRRRRLTIIVAIGVALVAAGVVPYAIGSHRANDVVDQVRDRARSAVIDPSMIAGLATSSTDPVATALGVADDEVSMTSPDGSAWCVEVEVRRLLATRVVRFDLGPGGHLTEVSTCPSA